jgi:hypothetical protein
MQTSRVDEIVVDGLLGTKYREAAKEEGEDGSRGHREDREQEPDKRILPQEITPTANFAAQEPNYK